MLSSNASDGRLRDLSPLQWKSGIAAWMGWFFDGLDIHLYTLVAAPFVAHLLNVADAGGPLVKKYSSWIQASFLIGWALGGGIFGRLGDRLGRSKALSLTILTYAAFTGLSVLAHTWWQLLIFRFVSALGIGGEWAVGACLLSETWPRRWGPWIAAVLQCGVNVGILCACLFAYVLAAYPARYLFLVGIIPALIVFWIRRHVPEPEEWRAAQKVSTVKPSIMDLFRGKLATTTLLTTVVCSLTLTGWWAFLFWNPQHLQSLPELAGWSSAEKRQLVTKAFFLIIFVSMAGNYFVSWLATFFGYRRVILGGSLAFAVSFYLTYHVPRGYGELMFWLPVIGFWSGIFGLFTMYLPPLFPTLLRTTGTGFCFNIGRIAAAVGTVIFGLYLQVGDFRIALMAIGGLFVLAAIVSFFLPESQSH
ncbi:MAG TPA: MFS transporter [Verrucomicrobiae bacterium]|jgi:predicted MFS family arabinose efflux permease|nr:MFS transporter [Verrucomicrobiae bacterium]